MRQYITLYLGGLTLVLVIIYSFMLQEYLIRGLDEASAHDLHLTAIDFARNFKENQKTPLPKAPRLNAFIGPEKLPVWVTKKYPPEKVLSLSSRLATFAGQRKHLSGYISLILRQFLRLGTISREMLPTRPYFLGVRLEHF